MTGFLLGGLRHRLYGRAGRTAPCGAVPPVPPEPERIDASECPDCAGERHRPFREPRNGEQLAEGVAWLDSLAREGDP